MQRMLLLALALLVSAPADALVFISGDGQGNTTAPPDDPGWNYVGRVSGLNGTYLGNGWMLTANHVPTGNPNFGGVWYAAVPGSEVQLKNPDLSPADLKVFRIEAGPSMPLMKIRATTPGDGEDVTMIAGGALRGASTSWDGYDGWFWGTTTGEHWATNKIYEDGAGFVNSTWSIATDFDKGVAVGSTTHEGQGAAGDSGGALFIKNEVDVWELAGVLFAIGPFPSQPDATALQGKLQGMPWQLIGNLTYSADLSVYRNQIIAITRPECANEVDDDSDTLVDWPDDPNCASELGLTELPDQDQDGVGNPEDNCLADANADQRDTDLDGYGNLCDGDFDDNQVVNSVDLNVFKQAYLKTQGNPGYDPDVDLDGGGVINATDLSLFRSMYLGAPGPSGLGCAGSPPCPVP